MDNVAVQTLCFGLHAPLCNWGNHFVVKTITVFL